MPESVSASGAGELVAAGAVGSLPPASGLPADAAPRNGVPHCGSGVVPDGSVGATVDKRSGVAVGVDVGDGVEPIGGRPHCAQAWLNAVTSTVAHRARGHAQQRPATTAGPPERDEQADERSNKEGE